MKMTEQAFIINKQLQGLQLLVDEDANIAMSGQTSPFNTTKTGMQAIVDAVLHPHAITSSKTLAAVNQSLSLFRLYKQVVGTLTRYQSPKQAAASSAIYIAESDFSRQGKGFLLKVISALSTEDLARQNKNGVNEAFVVIKLDSIDNVGAVDNIFLHCESENQIHMLTLAFAGDNKFQTIVSANNKAFKAIVNSESHLYVS
jgi:hypothetical protein